MSNIRRRNPRPAVESRESNAPTTRLALTIRVIAAIPPAAARIAPDYAKPNRKPWGGSRGHFTCGHRVIADGRWWSDGMHRAEEATRICPVSKTLQAPMRHMWTASWQALFWFGRLRSYVRPGGAAHMSAGPDEVHDRNPYQICELQAHVS